MIDGFRAGNLNIAYARSL